MKKEVAQIAEKIEMLIQQGITQREQNDSKWEQLYKEAMSEIESSITENEEGIKELEKDGFTVNRIECEGYLRALKQMLVWFKKLENYTNG